MLDTTNYNAKEQLAACVEWLAWQEEALSEGLKSAEDALRLWRFWQGLCNGPPMADEPHAGCDVPALRIAALGYDPLS